MDLLRLTVFFRPKSPQYPLLKLREQPTIIFFSSPPFFLLTLSFSVVSVILQLTRPKKPAFSCLILQMAATFVRFVFKKLAKYIYQINKKLRSESFTILLQKAKTGHHLHFRRAFTTCVNLL